jgi:hypothetical protein
MFNKRIVTKERVKLEYMNGGYVGLVKYLTNPDALLTQDEFSRDVMILIIHPEMTEDEKFIGVSLKMKEYGKL